MALGAVVTVRVPHGLAEARLADLRARLPAECGLAADDFSVGGPLTPEPDEWAMPVQDGVSRWYQANLYHAFWGPEYRRGDPPLLVRVAAWLEASVPGGEVWYGHDGCDDLRPFGPTARAELLAAWGDAERGRQARRCHRRRGHRVIDGETSWRASVDINTTSC